jgi:hypothetical protein
MQGRSNGLHSCTNVRGDATALMGGVDGLLSGEWKVGIHGLFGILGAVT